MGMLKRSNFWGDMIWLRYVQVLEIFVNNSVIFNCTHGVELEDGSRYRCGVPFSGLSDGHVKIEMVRGLSGSQVSTRKTGSANDTLIAFLYPPLTLLALASQGHPKIK